MKANIKLTPSLLKDLATDVFIDLTDAEIQEVIAIENAILQRFEKVSTIDTKGVKPLIYPFETPRTYLREDDTEPTIIDQSAVLANATTTSGPYITITKVIK